MTDEELAAKAGAGDADAFAELYLRHVNSVYGRVTRILGPTSEREDVTQEVFVRVHRALPTFRGDCRLTSFLYKIVVSVVHDHLRRHKRRPADLHDDMDDWIPAAVSAERRMTAREDLRLVMQAMQQLSARKRIAFWLTRIEGMTCDEAGKLVGARAPTMKQRALAAQRELQRYVAKRNGERT